MTINAVAFDGRDFIYANECGLVDIENRMIRFVGSAEQRLTEDTLRAFRFGRIGIAKIGGQPVRGDVETIRDMVIDKTIRIAAGNESDEITPKALSWERVRDEFFKMLSYPNNGRETEKALKFFSYTGLLDLALPEVSALAGIQQNSHHIQDVFEHTLSAVRETYITQPTLDYVAKNFKSEMDFYHMNDGEFAFALVRFIMLLHDTGKNGTQEFVSPEYGFSFLKHEVLSTEFAITICRRFKLSDAVSRLVVTCVREHMAVPEKDWTDRAMRHWFRRVGEYAPILFDVRAADRSSKYTDLFAVATECGYVYDVSDLVDKACAFETIQKKSLPINGDQIMDRYGLKPSKKIGQLLDAVEEMIINDPLVDIGVLWEQLDEVYNYRGE